METLREAFIECKKLLLKNFTVQGRTLNCSELGYRLVLDNSKKQFGCCNYRSKTIKLSAPLIIANLSYNPNKILDTMLHEIAHAFHYKLYCETGHNQNWVNIALEIGCNGKQYYDSREVRGVTKTFYHCKCCHNLTPIVRVSKYNKSCGSCCKTYNPTFKLEIITMEEADVIRETYLK